METKVTDTGVKKLQQALPKCKIIQLVKVRTTIIEKPQSKGKFPP
jgi:hypothetical protein